MTGFQQARPYDTGVAPFDANEVLQAGQQTQLGALGMQLQQIKAQRAAADYRLQQQMLAGMTDKERLAFSFAPEQAGGQLAKSIYPENKQFAVGGKGVWDPAQQRMVYESDGVQWEGAPGAGANLRNAAPPAQSSDQAKLGGSQTFAPGATGAPRPLSYPDAIQNRENRTGNPAARNPNSSAAGDHQFLDGTWLDMMRTYRPDLVKGKSDAEVLAMRSNHDLSAEMTQRYAEYNTPTLTGAGFEASETNLAIMHGFGPTGGLRILQAERQNPNTQLSTVISAEAMKKHPELRGLSIAQGRQLLEQQLGGGTGAAPQPNGQETPAPTANAGGWETATTRGGAPYGTGAKPGTYWQRRQTGVDGQGRPTYEYRTAPAGGGGPFEGTGDGQYWNEVLTGDPSTPQYAAAYAQLTKPQYFQVSDPEHPEIMVTKEYRRQLPPNIRVPTYTPQGGAGAQPPAVAGTGSATEIPGTQKAPGQTAADKQKLQAAEVEFAKISSAIQSYREVIKRTGAHTWSGATPFPSAAAAEMNTAYNNVALLAKGEELYKLGVLNGPDLEIIRRILADPGTVKGVMTPPLQLTNQIDQVEKILNRAMAEARKQYGPKPLPGKSDDAADPLRIL